MFYSDKIYNSDYWPPFIPKGVDIEAYMKIRNIRITNQNFNINTWKYTAESVPRVTSENLSHEWPDSTPFWKYIEAAYKNAAKGFSEELQGKRVTRLCMYVTLRARPTYESVCIAEIWKGYWVKNNDAFWYQHGYINNELTHSPNPLILTGQFFDMPDGRWHYVYLDEGVYRDTSKFYWKYLRPEARDNAYREEYFKLFGEYPDEETAKKSDFSKAYFRFGFVREDLIGYLDLGDNPEKAVISAKEVSDFFSARGYTPNDDWYDARLKEIGEERGIDYFPQKLEYYRPLYPSYPYPCFYEYNYEYYEYPENGYSYLYNLIPLRLHKKNYKEISELVYLEDPNIPLQRVNAYPNGGDPDFMEDWADEIKANMDIENGTSDHNPSTKVVEKNVLAGAGVLALGLLLLKNNM